MKRIFVLLLAVLCAFSLFGCKESEKENANMKAIKELEPHMLDYTFTSSHKDQLLELKDTEEFKEWLENIATHVGNNKYDRVDINALTDSLNMCDIADKNLFENIAEYYQVESYHDKIRNEDLYTVLQELENLGYMGENINDYYYPFKNVDYTDDIYNRAKVQFTAIDLNEGYYSDVNNRHERSNYSDEQYEYRRTYKYLGDFCIESQRAYHKTDGYEISGTDDFPVNYKIFYKGELYLMEPEILAEAKELYLDLETGNYVIRTNDDFVSIYIK